MIDLTKEPTKASLKKLLSALRKHWSTWDARTKAWDDIGPDSMDDAVKKCQEADQESWKPVQIAFIEATKHINSYDKWPLVNGTVVIALLEHYKLLKKEKAEPHIVADVDHYQ